MKETKLPIKENGQYKNITLKTKYKRNGKLLVLENGQKVIEQQGLNDQEYIILTKKYVEGRLLETKYGDTYSVIATYNGQDVSFFLNPVEHTKYASIGGVGDKIKITNKKEAYVNKITGAQMEKDVLTFELVK